MKRGDGPINFKWGPRYVIVDQKSCQLKWYQSKDNKQFKKANGVVNLKGSSVSELETLHKQPNAFSIQAIGHDKPLYFSGKTPIESQSWHTIIKQAS